MSGLQEVRIGDIITLSGTRIKLLRIEDESIIYEVLNPKGPIRFSSYGLRAFEIQLETIYGKKLIK